MDYRVIYPDVYIRYHAFDMILKEDSNAAYLVMPNDKSHIARYFQLNDNSKYILHPNINSAILVVYKILKNIVSSAAKVE